MPEDIQLEAIGIVLGENLHLYNVYLEIKKDAERYRFLRDGLTGNEAWDYFDDYINPCLIQILTQPEFDAQVDKGMKTTKGETK